MSDARTAILGRIRRNRSSVDATAAHPSAEGGLDKRETRARPIWEGDSTQRFTDKLTEAAATVARVHSTEGIPRAVADYIQTNKMQNHLVSGSSQRLNQVQWPDEWQVDCRAARAEDSIVLTEAYCGIAETGSVVLRSGPETPTTLNFLTEHFLCILPVSRIVDTIDDVWSTIRAEMSAMPRALNLITGPSRTADVEQTIQLGAHGPQFVHVLLLGES